MISVTGVDQVQAGLTTWLEMQLAAMRRAMDEVAALLEAYAKDNHPWQNRTGMTEETTDAHISEADRDHITVTLFAAMYYDRFLELAHDGTWSWLCPAMLANLDQIQAILVKHGTVGKLSGAVTGYSQRMGVLSGPSSE